MAKRKKESIPVRSKPVIKSVGQQTKRHGRYLTEDELDAAIKDTDAEGNPVMYHNVTGKEIFYCSTCRRYHCD